MKILALIPAYNEEGCIDDLIDKVKSEIPDADIVVINDGSTDRTLDILHAKDGITTLDLPFNMGIGATVLAGFNYFLEHDYQIVIRMDGDGQHPPDQAGQLIEAVRSGDADMAIGSRYLRKDKEYSSFTRMMGLYFLNKLTSFILRKKYTDNTSGFRAYDRKVIEFLIKDYPYDYPEPEEIYLLTRSGYSVKEYPVTMRARETGISSISTVKTFYFLIKVLLTIFVKYTIGGKR